MSKKLQTLAVILFFLCLVNAAYTIRETSVASKVLRLHILANSDSSADQAVKLKVRNAIGILLEKELENSESLAESEQIVREKLPRIIRTAELTLKENGFDYGADAVLAKGDFPEKSYGSYTFPAGEYEALRVTLGEGEGHNWWCVLYPNLCFEGSLYEAVTDDADEKLKEVLTEEEYESVLNSGKVQIRFKFLEYFR